MLTIAVRSIAAGIVLAAVTGAVGLFGLGGYVAIGSWVALAVTAVILLLLVVLPLWAAVVAGRHTRVGAGLIALVLAVAALALPIGVRVLIARDAQPPGWADAARTDAFWASAVLLSGAVALLIPLVLGARADPASR